MTNYDRRTFLHRAGTLGGAALLAPSLQGLVACVARGTPPRGGDFAAYRARRGEGGYGEPRPAGPELALPAGFSYVMFGVEGSLMTDGNRTPKAHDGMGAFALPDGNIRLIRNHEDRDPAAVSRVPGNPATAYDAQGGGGTTSLEVRVNPDGSRELVRDFISLNGTIVNCAGGPTPWASWLSCEETTEGETVVITEEGRTYGGRERDHGYIFEVSASAEAEVDPVPLRAMGRFVHEAVALDPATGIAYETEDRGTAGFYRFIPDQPGRLAAGGRLEILGIRDQPGYITNFGQRMGVTLPVVWIPIDDPDPAEAETNPLAVFQQGLGRGAAVFSRLEGCWYADDSIFFHATDGGDAELGQVWQYRPTGESGGDLTLVFESPDASVLQSPDNITVSPRGGIVICEDTEGAYVRGLTPDGRIFEFARNIANGREFAGACFSPDGETLFVNIQGDTAAGGPGNLGMTFAIWGPWEEGVL